VTGCCREKIAQWAPKIAKNVAQPILNYVITSYNAMGNQAGLEIKKIFYFEKNTLAYYSAGVVGM
jgi:hypothetical protein